MPDKESLHHQHSSGSGKVKSKASPSSSVLWSSVVAGTSSHVQHSVTGSYHQGSNRFKYGGFQCMAVGLVSLAKHAVDSVFAWQVKDLDRVVVLGDQLYTSLRDNKKISGSSKFLCVPDLPKHWVIDGHNFEFRYGDYVSGDVSVVDGEFIQAGIFMSLQNSLKNMFEKYDTCLLTLCGTTCAVIRQNGRYAVVDSHARSAAGMPDPNGNSVVVYFSCLKEVYSFICNLSTSLTQNDRPYEIAGVRVICGGSKSELRTTKCTDTVTTCETASMAFGSSLVCGIPSGSKVDRGTKRKITGQTCAAKKMKRNNVAVVNSDVVFVSDVTSKKLWFDPICKDVAQALCTQFNVEFEKYDAPMPTEVGLLGTPCKNEKIVADGNCFFRAISQAVSGTQKNHRKIRLAVVKQLESNAADYKSILRSEYSSVVEYIKSSKMRYVGSWATEVEIQAAADCLGVNIFTYHDDRWLEYSCKYRCFSKQGIYLENCNGNHYESVVCVHQPELHSCYGSCKLNRSESKVYDLRRQSAEECSWVSAVTENTSKSDQKVQEQSTATNNAISKYFIKKKYLQMKKKYQESVQHREKRKEKIKVKYQKNVLHREKVKEMSVSKYRRDMLHREKVKEMSVSKYRRDMLHRQSVKAMTKARYYGNADHKKRVLAANKVKGQQLKEKEEQFDFVMQQFLAKVKDGPEFVCCVCHRLLFRHQVLNCKRDFYNKNEAVASFADKCITEVYLHKCNKDCEKPCQLLDTARGCLWICYTCHGKINKGIMPPECAINSLKVDPIPPELACLNSLEQHLISLHIPFMKMLALPKGGQNGVHGPVTCVPANIVQTSNVLPRCNMEGSLLRVKLKRKLTYKGHYEYQFVDTMHVRQALQYLKRTNVHYKDVEFNEAWLNEFCREEGDLGKDTDGDVESGKVDCEDELLHDRQQHCMFQDTCLMPVDIGQEMLDQYFDDILNLAPAEGNSPVKLLSDHANEAKCFPVLFPQGRNTYHESRANRLTLSRYFNNRILHADGRFAHNVEYIFFAQYMSEIEQVVSNVSIALRKGKGCMSQNVPDNKVNDMLKNDESLKKLLEFDDGYRFLKPIRGTPAFWQGAQRDLLACVRQLGVPTWFCSFSSADMRWTNLLDSILKQEGRAQTAAGLEWADRCDLLRCNPVTAARMFDFRWHVFLREVLMSPSHPIGKIKDYFYRVEFQQRGSPHVHCLFWIENAPLIDKNTDEEVVEFIDKYITCELPSQDETLLETVTSVQQHSKRHSKTCKKKNTVCRFNFPRPASARTFICRRKDDEECKKACSCETDKSSTCVNHSQKTSNDMKKKHAAEIMTKIKNALSNEKNSFDSVVHLFQSVGIDQVTFEAAYTCLARNTHIVLKRQVNEVWINQYSKPLLKCWQANLDLQFVVDAYACVVYIISYMSKAEREMGLLLGNAQREASKEGNVSAKEALKNLGSVYLHNRDVCAQEAVYRLTNMHLKECSRKVVFVPTGDNIVRMSLPLSVLKQKARSRACTSEDVWMTSFVDRYKNRPNDSVFNDMCMATFASEYRVLSKNEKSQASIKLKNDCGFITKRTRTDPAVVRYARFSETKNPELFYQSIMQLFLPYRADVQLKPPNCETFAQFYENGHVRFSDGSRHPVKSVVDLNRSHFEIKADELDEIQNTIDRDGVLEDAWCELCPEKELERLQCDQEQKDKQQIVEEHEENIPDLAVTSQHVAHLEKRKNIMCRSEGLALIRSLNETQLAVFYQIRQWCLEKVLGKNPDPFHIFITGGAGTGKSHLIKAIQYEAMRLLSTVCRHPDNISVLLTAPTGIAAYNLHASTIHHTFSIGKDVGLPYTPLGEEKVNSLRAKYSDLQILIVDEISMVDHRLLSYIHGRLRQIKQTGDFSPFGNVSVVAVGDFFQLPPVKGKPLYVDDVGVSLWSNLFKVVELKQIVRQKDNVFAELLNRVRTRSKGTPMLSSDIQILKHCETGEVSSALHIFPTNKQVNEHNLAQLLNICPEYVEIDAQDFVNNKKTGKLELKNGHHAKTYNTCLTEQLLLGENARVMLCKNVDVTDGLVNGVCGTVTHIVGADKGKFPLKVYVKFDDEHVGAQRRKQSTSSLVFFGSTGIEPEEEKVTNKGGMRRQFPLKLAWACTVHKVQGITVDSAVVSLKKVFSAGQAYVALSRVRSLSGLVIQDFEDKAIYCKDGIQDTIQSMPQFLNQNITRHKFSTSSFTVFLMNVQNLTHHVSDLALCTQQLQLNCIAVTETWLPAASSFEAVKIDGFTFHGCPRSLSYNSNIPALIELQGQQHGGVGFYSADNLEYNIIKATNVNLECFIYNYVTCNILIAVIYRPPSYPMSLFKEHLGKLVDWLDPKSNTIAIMGDFNEDILKSSTICKFLTDKGYIQYVTQPTTEKGTLIDHVYVKTSHYEIESVVLPTYFSDHEAVVCSFKCISSDIGQ
ncbi:uncharacterized protein LOC121898666 isoform X1 [Thunnus maccoyii]|uniref:uncharacterized protein LOC121898576 isoform X1 n=1 Tax=Thunnus maccoyii TaxID=8240 RepID=UPI001C4CDD6A|nr:uncharacterized protein LOC121898576 isoform X1 [Thunnus maccoyii]XP_042269959.1 uncharacterized protein LOC121898666 isoform X1 [Thunnus maccoyii]